ncbi:MAG: hypothetical protein K2N03_06935 [Muribaculaceae bacterium]|nr:hypothetical protein [Muribaculaceae bacterium]
MKIVRLLILSIFISLSASLFAVTLSKEMEEAVDICKSISDGFLTYDLAKIKNGNERLKKIGINDWSTLHLSKGKELNINGHLLFDEVFLDSIIKNHKHIVFAQKYLKQRGVRGVSSGRKSKIKMTTKGLPAGGAASWKASGSNSAEIALVAEPRGLLTMTIRDEKGKSLFTETVKNKKGDSVRKIKVTLPKTRTRFFIEVKNYGDATSFALISR